MTTDGGDITVSDPGKATIYVRDPRPLRPPAPTRRNPKRRPRVGSASPSIATTRSWWWKRPRTSYARAPPRTRRRPDRRRRRRLIKQHPDGNAAAYCRKKCTKTQGRTDASRPPLRRRNAARPVASSRPKAALTRPSRPPLRRRNAARPVASSRPKAALTRPSRPPLSRRNAARPVASSRPKAALTRPSRPPLSRRMRRSLVDLTG